ncbi:SDH family Clp fold serine proteinase [Bradyrhizobium zhanjiangense]|uniref:SDH family Clp fold serine proteinase n=1 Tax=Bradyrhizobium zhanjiangense TaxID=1325107 RepID=UPI00100931C3|nr:serine protease [Bradyrhizobium zhanjiangense]
MNFATRKKIYTTIERERETKVITFVTSDRAGVETQIAPDSIDLFVDLLDHIGPTKRISLLLHTNGGHTSAAWRLVNLIRTFCDELEVLIPLKAMSAGTLLSLGAHKIVMTKQAALGPIDPSINHALGPQVPYGNQLARVPVSVEAVKGYLDAARNDLNITDQTALAQLIIDLSNKVHPLVLGEIFRSRAQIRFLAEKLLAGQVTDPEKVQKIIDFLCADSGSHDYTMNRREAESLGLKIEKPTQQFYQTLRKIHLSYAEQLKLIEPYSPQVMLGANPTVNYSLVRGLVESTKGGCYGYLSEGALTKVMVPGPTGAMQESIADQRTFEGWRKIS